MSAFAAAFAGRLVELIGPRLMAAFLAAEFPDGPIALVGGRVRLSSGDDRAAARIIDAVRARVEETFGSGYLREIAEEAYAESVRGMDADARAALRRALPEGLLAPEPALPHAAGSGALLAINTQLLQQTQELEEALERAHLLTAAIEHAGDAVVVADAEEPYLMRFANPQWERLTGRRAAEFVDKQEPPLFSVLRADPAQWERFRKGVASAGDMRFEVDLPRGTGGTVPVEAVVNPVFDAAGVLRHFAILVRDLTERRRQAGALAALERRYRIILENTTDMVAVMDASGALVLESPTQERVLGRAPGSMAGKSVFSLVHPEDVARVRAFMAEHLKTRGAVPAIEMRLAKADGTYIWAEVLANNQLANPEVRGIVVSARDITERKRAERLFAKQEARFRALIEQSYDMIHVVDRANTVLYCTPSVTPILGYAPEEFMGMPAHRLMHPDDVPFGIKEFARMVEGGRGARTPTTRLRLRHKNGDWVTVETTASNFLDDPDLEGIVVHTRDVTPQVKAEAAVRQVEALRDRLAGLSTGTFLNTVHVARWNIGRLLEGGRARLATGDAQVLQVTLDALTDAARQTELLGAAMVLEQGETSFRVRSVTFDQVWKAGPIQVQKRCATKGVACTVHVPRTPLPKFRADPEKLARVLEILLTNAVSYTKRGGAADVRASVRNGTVRIEVADTGIGIPAAEQPRVFDLFMRGSNTGEAEGAGVGLFVVKRYVDGMGGKIGFRSKVGVGTTFWIDLPAA